MTPGEPCPRCGAEIADGSAGGSRCPSCDALLASESADALTATLRGAPAEGSRAIPAFVGPYRILDSLGEGGMGIVYLAEQTEPIRRRVALKVIKPGMDSREVLARFEVERQALAVLTHPNVARVFDAGATADGRPYFVMEYVPGVRITAYCDMHCLSVRERLLLFTTICEAIQHAHQKGVVHRDLKPSNVLVATEDGKPQLKVIDFGLAKATEQRLTEQTLFTREGMPIGTPEYMSPEQAGTPGVHVDARTDIYSLGVLLYELLVGALPFDAAMLRNAAVVEMLRIIQSEDPPTPTTKFNRLGNAAELARRRHTDVRSLARQLRGDLEWITMRALEKEPARRYPSASELAADVRRHLDQEPVLAGPPTRGYRLKKFVRRHRTAVAVAAAFVITLLGALLAITSMYLHSETARRRAETEAARNELEAQAVQAVLLDQGPRYESLSRRAMDLHRRILGNDARLSLYVVNRLKILAINTGSEYRGPEALTREALDLVNRSLESGDPSSLNAAALLAEMLDPPQALQLAEHALALTAGKLKGADDETVTSAEKLFRVLAQGASHRSASDDPSLETVYRESLSRREQMGLAKEPGVAWTQKSLASVLERKGGALMRAHRPDAVPVFRETLALLGEAGEDKTPRAWKIRSDLAGCLIESGQFDEAEKLLVDVIPALNGLRGAENGSTQEAVNRLASVYAATGRADAAARTRASLPQLFVTSVSEMGPLRFDRPAFRDGAYSALVGKRSVWVFGDTSTSTADSSRKQVTIGWTDNLDASAGVSVLNEIKDSGGAPADALPLTAADAAFNAAHEAAKCAEPPCGVRWRMVPRAVALDQQRERLIVFCGRSLWQQWRPDVLGGTSIAVWSLGTLALHRPAGARAAAMTALVGADEPQWGSAAVAVGDDLYVYACQPRSPAPRDLGMTCLLARTPLSTVLDRSSWRFFAGNGQWSREWKDARPVLEGGIQWGVMSVHWNAFAGKFIAVSSRVVDSRIQIRTADRPEGPWSEDPIEVDTLESGPGWTWTNRGLAHPELSPDGGRTEYLTYRRNVGNLREIRLLRVGFGRNDVQHRQENPAKRGRR